MAPPSEATTPSDSRSLPGFAMLPRRMSRPVVAPTSRHILGMSGPVWTLAAWSAVYSMLVSLSLLAPLSPQEPFPIEQAIYAMYLAMMGVAILLLRSKTPMMLVYLNVLVWVSAAPLMTVTATPVEIAVVYYGSVIAAAYVGYWMSLLWTYLFGALWAAGTLGVLVSRGIFFDVMPIWVSAAVISFALATFLGLLTRYLRQIATIDRLTDLLNRRGLYEALQSVSPVLRETSALHVVVLDLDKFKTVNDTLGHAAGDEVLRRVADRLRTGLRDRDIIARTGGDEFCIIMLSAKAENARRAIERVGAGFPIGWSYGLTTWGPNMTFDEAFSLADAGMYKQKETHHDAVREAVAANTDSSTPQ